MELLAIIHTDFTMSIGCGKFDAIWTKAKSNIGEQGLGITFNYIAKSSSCNKDFKATWPFPENVFLIFSSSINSVIFWRYLG